MREIKFRAWDKVKEEWTGFMPCEYTSYLDADYKSFNIRTEPNIELMQYTGLKDTNEKDVYESDIIELLEEGEKKLYVVYYDRFICGFRFFPGNHWGQKGRTQPRKIRRGDVVRVVGNLYQSPQLLK